MAVKDFLSDTDGDLLIVNGDFVIGESDEQHNYDIMKSEPGWWKEYPLVGFGPLKYLNSQATFAELNQSARIQLQADGCKNITTDLSIVDGEVSGTVNGYR